MTRCTSDLAEQFLPQLNGFAIWARRRPYRNGQRFLKYTRCCDVADKQFVYYAVLIRIGIPTETFDGLHTMMLTEGFNTKLPNRAHRPLAREGLDNQVGIDPGHGACIAGAEHAERIPLEPCLSQIGVADLPAHGNCVLRQNEDICDKISGAT